MAGTPEPDRSIVDLLTSTALFPDLPEEALVQMGRAFKSVSLAAGEEVVREGEPGDTFYIVQTSIAVVVRNGELDEIVEGHLNPGDYFGEMALLTDAPRAATVRCATDVVLLELPQTAFDYLLRDSMSSMAEVGAGIESLQFLRPIPLFRSFGPAKCRGYWLSLNRCSINRARL